MPSQTIFACLLLFAACAAHAQQYRWVDEKGRVQYSDTPPPPHARGVQKKILGGGASPDGQEAFALQVARRKSPVKLYSAPDCGSACDDARNLLAKRGIPFSEVSVTQVSQIDELKKVSGSGVVPVMLVGSAVQKGFNEDTYHRALDAAGYPKTGSPRPSSQAPAPAAAPAPAGPATSATPAAAEASKAPAK